MRACTSNSIQFTNLYLHRTAPHRTYASAHCVHDARPNELSHWQRHDVVEKFQFFIWVPNRMDCSNATIDANQSKCTLQSDFDVNHALCIAFRRRWNVRDAAGGIHTDLKLEATKKFYPSRLSWRKKNEVKMQQTEWQLAVDTTEHISVCCVRPNGIHLFVYFE